MVKRQNDNQNCSTRTNYIYKNSLLENDTGRIVFVVKAVS